MHYPLGRRGKIIGTPGQGTHSWTSPPNNWESDNAVDIAIPKGTKVIAVDDGVIGSQFGPLGSGDPRFAGIRLHLVTKNDEFYYAHLSRTAHRIRPGVHVKKGDVLGYSGVANGVAHLHLGKRNGYSSRNGQLLMRQMARAGF